MNEHPLERVFRPRSVALYGVPRNLDSRSNQFFLRGLIDQGFHPAKPLYLVNPRADEIGGLRSYGSLLDCPDPVDYVISLVPAGSAGDLVEQCIAKRVHCLHLYTGGFAESLDPDRAELEQALIYRATANGIRVIGPNCMGLYHPAEQMSFLPGYPKEPGDVMAISQSGGNAMEIITALSRRGIRFSKVISFGNGRDVGAPELLSYAAADPATRMVLVYVEDVTAGRPLYEALRTCARRKPTIVLKGGTSKAGARAARSHTASLAGSSAIFRSACRQAGAAVPSTLDDLLDLAVATQTALGQVAGPRAVLVGTGGGYSVLTTDALAELGIELPEVAADTLRRLRDVVPLDGNSIHNPIDASYLGDGAAEAVGVVLDAAARDANVDFLLTTLRWDLGPAAADAPGAGPLAAGRAAVDGLAAAQERSGKPVVFAGRTTGDSGMEDALQYALKRRVAIFDSPVRAGRAIRLLLEWRRDRSGLPPMA